MESIRHWVTMLLAICIAGSLIGNLGNPPYLERQHHSVEARRIWPIIGLITVTFGTNAAAILRALISAVTAAGVTIVGLITIINVPQKGGRYAHA